jgi:DNA polymerase-3 subunit delta'
MNYPWLTELDNRLKALSLNPPQAVCLVGVPGLGQEILAERFAQAILKISDLTMHPDYLRMSPESTKTLGIDKIREVTEFCLIAPTRSARKIVFIQPIEAMTLPAQQAFLKTLEEPVAPTTFILVCSQVHKLLPTLRSRCQVITLFCVPYASASKWFAEQHQSISSQAYALTDGAPLMVLQPEFKNRQSAYESLTDILKKKQLSTESFKTLSKAEPQDILTGFYYALMHAQQFDLIDKCIELRKLYSENANLNWEMQLNSFILEVQAHVV